MGNDFPLSQKFAWAVEQHRAGRIEQAQQAYREVLQANPRHAGALHLFGVAALHAGKPEDAIASIRQSIAIHAGNANVHVDLGNACQAANAINSAISAYRRAIQLQPGLEAAHSALSNALAKTGALEEAAAAAHRAISCDPTAVDAHKNLGVALHKAGKLEAAVDAYRAALALNGNDAEVQNNVGHALCVLGHPAEAIAHLRKATELAPQFAPGWFTLGNAYKLGGLLQQATAAFLRSIELLPEHVEPFIELAGTYQLAADFDQALRWLRTALDKFPRSALAHNNLAGVLQRLDHTDEAVSAFHRATLLDPSFGEAWGNLALLYEQNNQLDKAQTTLQQGLARAPDNALLNLVAAKCERRADKPEQAIQRLCRVQAQQPQNRQSEKIWFELGRLYDETCSADRAFASFTTANELARCRPSARFLATGAYRKSIAHLRRHVTSEWVSSWQAVNDTNGRAPVFLVGFPRSGTTLLEQILDAHSELATVDEQAMVNSLVKNLVQTPTGYPGQLPFLTLQDIDALRNDYWRLARHGREFSAEHAVIDKFPLNIIHVPLIQRVFPTAKFILALRHPCDVCLSCFMQDFELNEAMVNFLSLEDTVALYDDVMRLWRQYMDVLPVNYQVTRYEDVVLDVEHEARALLQFIGVGWDSSVLQFAKHARQRGKINTPSYHQVTQPIYQQSKYRWQRYRQYLEPYFDRLRPHCEAFAYQL